MCCRAREAFCARAVRLDPAFAEAQAELAIFSGEMVWSGFDASEARIRQAREAAETAARLAPDLPASQLALVAYNA